MVPKVTWPEAMARMDWRQGEHVTLIAPTGRGKTELIVKFIEARSAQAGILFLGTKREDSTQDRLKRMGFRTIQDADGLNVEISRRYILRPPWPRQASAAQLRNEHARVFRAGLMRAFRQKRWVLVVDEARYVAGHLKLQDELLLHWLQGRSQGSTVVAGTQRPRYVPLEAYDQATHLFLWSDPDVNNVKRVAEMAGLNSRLVMQVVPSLPRHDVLYLNTVTGDIFVTNTRW